MNTQLVDDARADIRFDVLKAGGRDVRFVGPMPADSRNGMTFGVIFAAPSGFYYQTTCEYFPGSFGTYSIDWSQELAEILTDQHPPLFVDIPKQDRLAARKAESQQLQQSNQVKETIIRLLHSAYRNERLWGIELSEELDIVDGVIAARIRDMAEMDKVKAVRNAALDRLAVIDGQSHDFND